MLFENRKQVTAEYLMMKYASREDYEKILKRPSFEVDKSKKRIDRVNRSKVKTNKVNMTRSSFMATDTQTRLKTEIRYATSNNTRIVGDKVIDQFEPRYVNWEGASFAYQDDIDKAVYLHLHPDNGISPLRPKSTKIKPRFEYIDVKKRSQERTSKMDLIATAMDHASSVPETELVILAKGLGIKGVDKKEMVEIRADIREFALNHPKEYNEKINTKLTMVEGKIWNLIDKGAIKLSNIGNTRQWSWAKGEREGEVIMSVQNVTQDARQALKNYFFSDMTTWINILNNISTDLTAREKAERDLRALEEDVQVVEVEVGRQFEPTIGDDLPDYLKNVGGQAEETPAVPKYNREDAIRILTAEDPDGNPPHHKTIEKWLKENN